MATEMNYLSLSLPPGERGRGEHALRLRIRAPLARAICHGEHTATQMGLDRVEVE